MSIVKLFPAMTAAVLLAVGTMAQPAQQQKNDTGFLARNIQAHILSIKAAQMAQERSRHPRMKALARDVIVTDRTILQNLLKAADPASLPATDEKELDNLINNFRTDSILSPNDREAARTSGNTVSDSLGSGSTGSGNVSGEDTGTIGRTYSNRKNRSYSAEGDYLYRNQPAIRSLTELEKIEEGKFNQSWLRYMLSLADNKLSDYEAEAAIAKDEKLKTAVLQAVPRLRTQKETIAKAAQREGTPAERTAPGTEGPSNRNTPASR